MVFDGLDEYLLLPSIENIKCVSMWMFLSSTQVSNHSYLVDTLNSSAYFDNLATSSSTQWSTLYIDGVER